MIEQRHISAHAGAGFDSDGQEEIDRFFFHSDHLGSTSYLTDHDGNVSQFVCYTPYGETLVDEHLTGVDSTLHNGTYRTRYLFNGKELDTETNLYYYGARYFEPITTLWYGVDPLAEIHHDYSPYTYCIANPIRYIDPQGLTEYSAEEASDPYVWHYLDTDNDAIMLPEIEVGANTENQKNTENQNGEWNWSWCEFVYNYGVSPTLSISEKHYSNQAKLYQRMSNFYETFGGGQVSSKMATKYQKVSRGLKSVGYINLGINAYALVTEPTAKNTYNFVNSGISLFGLLGTIVSIANDCYKAAGEYLIEFSNWINAQGKDLKNWGNVYMFGF